MNSDSKTDDPNGDSSEKTIEERMRQHMRNYWDSKLSEADRLEYIACTALVGYSTVVKWWADERQKQTISKTPS
jgi:hypothetical protein